MKDFVIRKIVESDINRVCEIWVRASLKAHDFVDPDFWISKEPDMREKYIPMSETWVYEEKKQVLGFFSLFGNTLAALFIIPSHQGMGIGSKLMEKAMSLRESLDLSVYSENRNSIKFYEKHGFKAMKEQVDEHTGAYETLMELGKKN
jgi:putative acetyltransferase